MLAAAVDNLPRFASFAEDSSSNDNRNEQHQYNTQKNPDSDSSVETVTDGALAEVIDTCDG